MRRTVLAVHTPTDEDKQLVVEKLNSISGVMSADMIGDEAIVHCGNDLDDEDLVDAVYHCRGCSAEVICDDDEEEDV